MNAYVIPGAILAVVGLATPNAMKPYVEKGCVKSVVLWNPVDLGYAAMQVLRAVSGRAPLHLTSVGKLFLAEDDPQRVRAYALRTGLAGHTRNSITDLPTLERELIRVRSQRIARDNEELELGVRCLAAGIHDDQGHLVAGLSISAPTDRMEEGWLDKVKATAAEISERLGWHPA